MTSSFMAMTTSQMLQRPEGRVAYDVEGSGPLVVCLPAMGELRSSYRHLTPLLVEAGFRVATLDLRGHGDSETTFTSYDDEALASDALALVDELGGPAYLVGNSMGAGAAVIAAAERPEAVSGLVLVGPFVRNPPGGAFAMLMFRLALLKPWGPAAFMSYYPKWTPGHEARGVRRAQRRRRRERPAETGRPWSRTTHTHARAGRGPARRRAGPRRRRDGHRRRRLEGPGRGGRLDRRAARRRVLMAPGVGHYTQAQAPAWSPTRS